MLSWVRHGYILKIERDYYIDIAISSWVKSYQQSDMIWPQYVQILEFRVIHTHLKHIHFCIVASLHKCIWNDVCLHIFNKQIYFNEISFCILLYFFPNQYLTVWSGFGLCFNVNYRFMPLFIFNVKLSPAVAAILNFISEQKTYSL